MSFRLAFATMSKMAFFAMPTPNCSSLSVLTCCVTLAVAALPATNGGVGAAEWLEAEEVDTCPPLADEAAAL